MTDSVTDGNGEVGWKQVGRMGPYHVIRDGEVGVPQLVINHAGCVKDVIGDGEVDHLAVCLREAHGWSKKIHWGAVTQMKNFPLERDTGANRT